MIRSPVRSTARFAIPAALIVLAGCLVYWPSIRGGWIWDDAEEVAQNPVLRDSDGLEKIWFAPAGTDYFPLKTTVQWLEWRAWGDDPAGYHAVGIALHLLSAFLFWRLLRRLGLRWAWAGGLLFAVHPLAVESVAWIAELKNTLSLPFLLLAMLAYVEFSDRSDGAIQPGAATRTQGRDGRPARPLSAPGSAGARPYYLLSLVLFLLAMLSKSSVVMFPVVILLYCWWKRGRIGRADLAGAAPFFAVSLGLGFVTVWFQHHRAIVAGHRLAGSLLSRLAGAGLSLGFYLGKCLWPTGLLPIYPRWEIDPVTPLDFAPWLAMAAIFACLWSRRDAWGRHAIFGLGFFAVNLLPVTGLVAMSYLRISRVADHFAYVPLLGILGLAVAGADRLTSADRPLVPDWLMKSGIAAVALALAWQAHGYAEIFRNERTLWSYTVARNPGAWAAQGNLGYALFQEGRVAEAIPLYREALRLNPDYAEARYDLGTALLRTNDVAGAIAEYEQAVRLQPASAEMQNNLGTALVRAGRLADAAGHFEAAVALEPDYAEAHHNLGNAMLLTGRLPEAVRQYEEALRLDPGDAAAKSGLEIAERALQNGK
jgi:tetratricopeptide (TPR) repeat protein